MIRTDYSYDVGVEHGQDVFDLAIQEYGSIEMVFDVLIDNADIISTISDAIPAASVFEFKQGIAVPKPEVRKWFKEQRVFVNTHNVETSDSLLLQENYELLLQENSSGIIITSNNNDVEPSNIITASNTNYAVT